MIDKQTFKPGDSFALKAQLHGAGTVRVYEGLARSLEITFGLVKGGGVISYSGVTVSSSPVDAGAIREVKIDSKTEFIIPGKVYDSNDRRSIIFDIPAYHLNVAVDREEFRKSDGVRIFGYWQPIHPGFVDPLDDETNIITLPPKSFEAFGL